MKQAQEGTARKALTRRAVAVVLFALGAAFLAGRWTAQSGAPAEPATATASAAAGKSEIWTCSMHPQIRQPKFGRCPLCAMDLIPAGAGSDETGDPRTLTLSKSARALAEVETSPVERRFVETAVRMVGKVQFDETRQAYIAARFAGRIDKLYANVTGTRVKAGEHLADIYSPELLSAQKELMQAASAAKGAGGREAEAMAKSVREKLRLWGVTAEQIAEVERGVAPRDHMTLYAPIGGVVVEKEAVEGLYVEPGMRLFTVADLSSVWVTLDAYESDLGWVRYGQKVEFQVEAYPGEVFGGTVALVAPVLDAMTRTVKVRVNALNPDGRLKPEMFVKAVVKARVADGGGVIAPDMRGKWVCSMHPEVVAAGAGECTVCRMPLVTAAAAGYDDAGASTNAPLVIPATAPLLTGARAVVYVAVSGREGTYEGREVTLGPRAGDFYVVRAGLTEGERVVTRGNFKIDSSLQIEGKMSMMTGLAAGNEAGGMGGKKEGPAIRPMAAVPAALEAQARGLLDTLCTMGVALAGDDLAGAKAAAGAAVAALGRIDAGLMDENLRSRWRPAAATLSGALAKAAAAADIGGIRNPFADAAEPARVLAMGLGARAAGPLHVAHCPMAFGNKGASWVQRGRDIRNPYFGAAMLACGEIVESFVVEGGAEQGAQKHE